MRTSFKEVKQLSYADMEVKVLAWWKENSIFQESLKSRGGWHPVHLLRGAAHGQRKAGDSSRDGTHG